MKDQKIFNFAELQRLIKSTKKVIIIQIFCGVVYVYKYFFVNLNCKFMKLKNLIFYFPNFSEGGVEKVLL